VTFCERLRLRCVQSRGKNRFAPEKTQLKKALIISFVARVNQESNPWVERSQFAIKSCFLTSKNHQVNQRDGRANASLMIICYNNYN
jgi:hypothetical protein